jgi:murein tripeptide amidase MpaA
MIVDDDLEGGSIVVVGRPRGGEVELALRPDTNAPFVQWFHFRVRGAPPGGCRLRVVNAGEATFARAFEGYRAFASYDLRAWFRVPTSFDGETLVLSHRPAGPRAYYAYFATYPRGRRERLLRAAARSPRARVGSLGRGAGGGDVNVVAVGDEGAGRKVWVVARQHAGEAMAEWFAEGLLRRLLDPGDAAAAALLERAVVYLIPNMNPDGSALGNQRVNAVGTDLNRAWAEPSDEASPEVVAARGAMFETGVDLFLDVHGDERLPYAFAAGCEGNPGYTDRLAALEDLFLDCLVERSDDFQREHGYDPDPPGGGDRRTAANFVGEAFDCLSLTLEMPFKDNADRPAKNGWTPGRSMALGRAAVESILACADALR